MGKKKRQGEPNTNSDQSTESCDENRNSIECGHIVRAVDLQKIKKNLQRIGLKAVCEECKKNPVPIDPELEGVEFDESLWLCLKCGNEGCGRGKSQHALQHFNTPHSDCHSMCVNTTNWNVWCYECDNEVNFTSKKKLLETVEYLKKQSEINKAKGEVIPLGFGSGVVDMIEIEPSKTVTINSSLSKARGLSNLGNTCFFNSVMQCLGQTPHLVKLLEETSQPGQYFKLPGGKVNQENSKENSIILDPLEGQLEEWRPLTKILSDTLRELQSGRVEVYNPRMLFSRLTQRMPQFGGGDQHDSHELLRHLLEAVREEDLRRYQAVILDKLGFSKKTDPTTVEGDKKRIVRFYGQQASEFLLPTEQVFRGILVSTLQCKDCDHISRRDEFFLDLSLPISEKQLPPVLRRKAEEIDDKPSKYQVKKEKRAANKKNKKLKSARVKKTDEDDKNGENSESESDADVEDNAEDSSSNRNAQGHEEAPRGTESGYNSDKNGSPDSNNRGGSPDMRIDDSGVPSPTIGMLSCSPPAPGSPAASPASSEANIDMGSPMGGHNSPIEDENDTLERPESRLSFIKNKNSDINVDLSKLSLLNDGDTNKINNIFNQKNEEEGACGGFDEDEKMDEDYDGDLWMSRMSTHYQCEEGECSIQSCLNQFTACELMTGNNKVACDLCTKRHGGPNNKTVYTNATKQLLVYNPPAVLILHLKRFQVFRFRSAKVNKFVDFPTVLDLAPFCSKRCQNLPTFDPGQTKVLYALYGVVEHSGSMHGGHYVAYVKVRPQLESNSYRWCFLPKNQSNVKENRGTDEPPAGKWYYISDSYVSEVPESKVLNAQAYLLFYERIL